MPRDAEAGKGMTAGVHGTTFGGNPLAMAVGNAVLDVIPRAGFLDGSSAGLYLKQRLAELKDATPR
jgi:acetylornithine/N-succinyldiaminopimelate aminotransferase